MMSNAQLRRSLRFTYGFLNACRWGLALGALTACSSETPGVDPSDSSGGASVGGGGASSSGAGPSSGGSSSVGAGPSASGGQAGTGTSGGAANMEGGSAGAGGSGSGGEQPEGGAGSAGSGGSGSAGGGSGGSGAVGSAGSSGTAGTGGTGTAGQSPAVDPGTAGDGDFTVGPNYPKSADLTPKNVEQGKTFDFTLESKNSKFYTGLDRTLLEKNQHSFTRAIKVYVPAKYQDGKPAPLFVVHDGPGQFEITKIALDNFTHETTAARRLPPFVIVSVANGGGDSKGSERGLEYDTMSDKFVNFVEGEVLPAVLANAKLRAAYPNFSFTTDPEGRGSMGCSSGGAAAFSMAWFRPDLYRRVLTYSATLVDQQDDDAAEEATYPLGAWEYHSGKSLIENAERKPLRIFLSTNESDVGNAEPESGHHNWVIANKRTAAILKSKGYHYRFLFGSNAGHAPTKLQENTLPEALLWLWRGYPVE